MIVSHYFLSHRIACDIQEPAANSLLCKTCNLSKPEPRWRPLVRTARQAVSAAFIESGSSWDGGAFVS